MTTGNAVTKNITIVNRRGLHARAAAKFTKLAVQFSCDIIVSRNGTNVPGRSLMGLLTLGASQGKDIDIICTGSDAEKAMDALSDLVARGFDEDDSPEGNPENNNGN
jgi:phosphocarrier protein HPr